MKRILLILTFLSLCGQMNAQATESCMAVVKELTMQKNVWSDQKAIDYIINHADSFDKNNEFDMWLYNLGLGTRYYPLKKYNEAIVCLRNVTIFLDEYGEQMELASNPQYLIAYYWEANSEFYTGASKEVVLAKLKKAKNNFEKYNYSDNETYKQILADINYLESGELDVLKDVPLIIEYVACSKFREAIPIIEQLVDNLSKSRFKDSLPSYYRLLGRCYSAVGRINEAEQMYLEALNELKKQNNEHVVVYRRICDELGVLYYQLHNYQKAKDFSGLSKWLHEKYMDFGESYITCLSNCALAEIGLGNSYMAKLFIDVALKYIRKGYKNTIDHNAQQALMTISSNNFDVASFDNNINKDHYIFALSNASMIYEQAGFWEDAVICMKECITIGEETGVQNAFAYNNMGTMYLTQSRVSESLPYFSKAIPLCATDYEKNEVLFNYALALWLLHSDQCSDIAIQTSKSLTNSITDNFSFLSQEEKYNYYTHFENYLPFINLMLYEEGGEKQYGYIYDNILTTKGLLLRASNDVKEAIFQSGNEELISNYNKMITLRQQILTEQDSIRRIDMVREIERLDKDLSRSAANYGAFAKFNSINWRDVQASLTSDDIAIEFYNIPIIYRHDTIQKMEGDPRYCAVILKKDYQNPKIIPLCKESELMDLDNDSLYSSNILNRLIWQPLESELKGIKNIYFSADRELHKIGIEYAQLKDGKSFNNIFNIYRLSSTRLLAESHEKEKTQNAVLYGGLLYDLDPEQLIAESRNGEFHSEKTTRALDLSSLRYGVKYLPGTKLEVEDISKRFAGENTGCDIITGISGTEESFKSLASKNIGIIHLATHGFYWSEKDAEERNYVSFLSNMNNKTQTFEDRALLRSGLFFSGANIGLSGEELPNDVEDGVLTAQELSAMNLGNVDMVVMSACQSGLGETSGEGVFGLQRGFKLAGANTLLMSLWKVDDSATKTLMTEFYKNYLSGKTKRESLQLAQQALRKDHPEPEYWAAFILLDALN